VKHPDPPHKIQGTFLGNTGKPAARTALRETRRSDLKRASPKHSNEFVGSPIGPGHSLRNTGLPAVGQVPWGSHFCIFYETRRDLLDILVPYFKAGLVKNEFCLWIVAPYEFLTIEEARAALGRASPELGRHSQSGRIEMASHRKWFGADGTFDASIAVRRFRKKLVDAERRGFAGLRVNGSSAWVREKFRAQRFREFEGEIDRLMEHRRMLAVCTFPLMLSRAGQILDAARTHQFGITVRNGTWKKVEIRDIGAAQRQAKKGKLRQLTFRQREILQHIAEGRNTKQIADLLGISIKTVESHRLQLMRRLKIDNIPGLVRFAIYTGLVSPED